MRVGRGLIDVVLVVVAVVFLEVDFTSRVGTFKVSSRRCGRGYVTLALVV